MNIATVGNCPRCHAALGPDLKACPVCGMLVYEQRLSSLATSARQSESTGDLSSALSAWREALPLLPVNSRQYQIIVTKITELADRLAVDGAPAPRAVDNRSMPSRLAGGAGAIGLMLWKIKALLLGLTKGVTLLSMFASIGVYWALWGWKFAVGFVLSIYVHEMGHVITLRRYGFKATAPMFIPGLGAVIRLQQQVVNPGEDAAIGLAGPVYGLGAALVAAAIWYCTKMPIFAAIAGFGAWVNLFNLLPVGTLDGGRAFHALSRSQKLIAAAAAGGAWYYTNDPMAALVGIVCVARAVGDRSDRTGSARWTLTYVFLVAALSAVARLQTIFGQ